MSGPSGTGSHLDIGGVFEKTGDIYSKAFGTFWIVALVLLIPPAILQWLIGDSALGGLVSAIVNIFATAWLAGGVVRIVQDVEADGQVDYSVGDLLGSVWPRLLAIVGLQIVVGIIIFFGLIFFIIPGIILALVLVVSLPALVVEDGGIFDSMGRSAALTKDNRMRILAVGILMILILVGIAIVAGLLSAITPIIGALAMLVLGVLLYPYIYMLTTVLYFRLVELKEGGVVAVEETVIVEEDADRRPPCRRRQLAPVRVGAPGSAQSTKGPRPVRRAPAAALVLLRESPGGPGSGSERRRFVDGEPGDRPAIAPSSEPAVSRPGAQREVAVLALEGTGTQGIPVTPAKAPVEGIGGSLIGSADPVGRTQNRSSP